ncbi:MAG: efflux RND transporter periplasmic adaptor subunit [Sulfitobacter sp.]
MRHLITALFALALLGGAYVLSFGVPAQVAQALPFLATPEADGGDSRSARGRPGAGRTTSVVLQSLEYEPYKATIQTIGSAASWRTANVLAETSGRVTEVLLTPNKRVSEGDVLVRLDDRTEKLDLEVAQAEMEQAQSVVDRNARLRADGNFTVTEVAITEANLALTQAKGDVGRAEVALDRRTIRAPFDGRLGLHEVEVGNLLDTGDMIVRVDDSDTLLIEFALPERAISMLELGRKVLASTPTYAGRVFEAEITAFDNRIDSTTRTISVEARIDNSDGLLWSGMTVVVRLLSETDPMPVLPATALNWTRDGAGIWVVKDGKAERRPVTVRFRQGGQVWVDTDVAEGDTVVVEGASKLRPGAVVEDVGNQSDAEGPIRATKSVPVAAAETDEDPA